MLKRITTSGILLLLVSLLLLTQAHAQSCENVVQAINVGLSSKIDQQELIEILRSPGQLEQQETSAQVCDQAGGPITGMETRKGSMVS